MHQTTPVRHHPDIRWVVVVTALVTSAFVLIMYVVWNTTQPVPAVVLQANAQAVQIQQLETQVTQLTAINNSLKTEIKNSQGEIADLKIQLVTANALVSATTTTSKPAK